MSFTHLHTHSYYSYGKGSSPIERLVQKAKASGYDALALTDTNTIAGVVEFYSMCKEYELRAIIGCEIEDASNQKAVLLCKSQNGYERLCRIVTDRQLNENFNVVDMLCENSDGLFVITGDLTLLRSLSGKIPDLYAELILISTAKKQNRLIYKEARNLGVPLVWTNDVYFADPEEHEIYRILASMKQLTTLYDLKDEVTSDQYLKPPSIISKSGSTLDEALRSTEVISRACRFEFTLKRHHCARYRHADGKIPDSGADLLRSLSRKGLEKRYGISDKHKPINYSTLTERLEYELEVITNLNFSDYFLICRDIVDHAHGQGYWHVGRGSAANSLVSYCLGLTEVDPVRYNLYFERFLNYARGSPPDIDLDFNWRVRDEILKYIYERYGQEHVAMMSSIHTLHARGALREVAKAYGVSERELDSFRRFIPHTRAGNLNELAEKYPEAKELKLNSKLYRNILTMAAKLDGFPHYGGIHSSGVVITERPVTCYSALERSANGFVKTQLDMYSGEDVGLIKFDILAVRGLGTIEDAVGNIERDTRTKLDIFNWDKIFADPKAQELMSTGKTVGVVHSESPFIRNAMRITKAKTFELLYIILGMVRTGCVESGMMYTFIERLLEPEKRKDALPALLKILPETFGVMIFEEDVIRVLHFVGGLSLEEADIVRRAMSGKRVASGVVQKLRVKFFRNCQQQIPDTSEIDTLWKQLESFSGFTFCKAHSSSYALMAFQGLYLRIHYPAHYMAAVLSNQGGFYTPSAYISECRRLGLKILPPDINRSDTDYKAEGADAIRIGLRFIANISSITLTKIMEERSRGNFNSLKDFAFRIHADNEEAVTLIRIGCFDFLEKKRTTLIALWDALSSIRKNSLSRDLFLVDLSRFESSVAGLQDLTWKERLQTENELLGYPVHHHPLEFYPNQINHPSIVQAVNLQNYTGKKVKMIGWLVSSKRIRTRDKLNDGGELIREGRYMKFMTMEDLTGIFDTVLFPDLYEKVAAQTLSYGPFCLEGIVDTRYQTVNVSRLELVRNHIPVTTIDSKITIEKQELYAKQKASIGITEEHLKELNEISAELEMVRTA